MQCFNQVLGNCSKDGNILDNMNICRDKILTITRQKQVQEDMTVLVREGSVTDSCLQGPGR